MLIDRFEVEFVAGDGGHGAVKYGHNKKPSGGDGGHGGNIYLEGSRSLYDLRIFRNGHRFESGIGDPGGRERLKGSSGKDLLILVPIETYVYDMSGNLLAEIRQEGQKVQIARGGNGGKGNYRFRGEDFGGYKKSTGGEKGEYVKAILELRLPADILFIGFPNAGKSSMLNSLANTDVKVASYPFTTLEPQLGTINGMVMMDFPGLIEDTSKGRGLGTKFLQHMKTARVIAHFLSLESNDVVDDYQKMRKELKEIDEELYNLPEIIILTKADMFSEDFVTQQFAKLKNFNSNIIITSTYTKVGLEEVKNAFREAVNMPLAVSS